MKQNMEQTTTKKKISYKKCLALISCVAVVAAASQTAFADNVLEKIIKSISTGHNQFIQMQPREKNNEDGQNPEEFENSTIKVSASSDRDETVIVTDTDGNAKEVEAMSKDNVIVSDSTKIQQYLNFKSMLPEYVPQGFEFDYAGLYKDENGSVSGDYLMVTYKNAETGERIYLHERIMNDETAFSTGALTLEETTINGNKAVISDNRSIDWEQDNASYGISGRGILNKAELIKMAESMK